MKNKPQIKINRPGISLVVLIFLFSLSIVLIQGAPISGSFHGGQETQWGFSNPQYNVPGGYRSFSGSQASTYWPALSNRENCEATTDFVMFIPPGGCSPPVIRSDLLEEQNVPIFCKVDIVKINPLIDVSQLKSVRFKMDSNSTNDDRKYIAGVNFHPNAEAIYSSSNSLDNPLINDAGYVVVVLKRIPSEKDMPEDISLNLTGVLRYDAQNFFGSATKDYYLEVMEDGEWTANDRYKENSFFKGRGYVRADWIDEGSAKISIYRDKENLLTSFTLEKGETSRPYYIPGFYCKAGVRVKLDDIRGDVKKVRLEVDDNQVWLVEGERFLDNECRISRIDIQEDKDEATKQKSVTISCKGKSTVLGYEDKIIENTDVGSDDKELVDIPLEQLEREVLREAEIYANDIEAFYGAVEVKGEILSAKALYEFGVLALGLNQSATAQEVFNRIIADYPGSVYANSAELKIGTFEAPKSNYKDHNIRLIEIKEPSLQDSSATFSVKTKEEGNNQSGINEKLKVVQENDVFNGYKLTKLESDKVELSYGGKRIELVRGESDSQVNDKGEEIIQIKLQNINLTEYAKISLISETPNAYSESDFLFEVGIEKRAIELSPEMAKNKIRDLNEQIKELEGIVTSLGKLVKGMKATCLATSASIIVKNLFTSMGGKATARQEVMPFWYKECERREGKDSIAFNRCLEENSKDIEKDINGYGSELEEFNKKMIEIEKANPVEGGSAVDRKKTAEAFRAEFFNSDENREFEIKSYNETKYDLGDLDPYDYETITLSEEKLQKASLTDLRDLEFNQRIVNNNDLSETAKQAAREKINTIVKRIDSRDTEQRLYSKEGFGWVNSFRAKYHLRGTAKDKVYTVPIPKEYRNSKGTIGGFYAVIDSDGYTEAGDIKEFWIQNIGSDEIRDISDDQKIFINYARDYEKRGISQFNMTSEEFNRLVDDAVNAIKTANKYSGQQKFSLFGYNVVVDFSGEEGERCQDFMSPQDCHILFNVCDPVICPSSRCNLGGKFYVDDVIQSGIIGSIALCLPNIGEGIAVPVCVSGIHAGLEAYLSILESYKLCLEENVETGKTVGICDEIHSIYLCEFFWRQAMPFLDNLLIGMLEKSAGQGMKGGGEYLTVQDAWKNAEDSVNFLKEDYAVNSYNAFQIRSTQDVGTELCKSFASAKVPNKGVFDNLIEPDSPVQFHAWFDEIPYSDVTVPATSQYKVFYHIWAGRDIGASYQVYLRSPDQSAYRSVQETVIVDTNYVSKGGYATETVDFTAPAGYKELCVRINGKDECGFKRVSTSFALDYASDKFYEDQLTDDIRTKDECITGSPSAYALVNPNIQGGVQDMITPDLDKKGITRICAEQNPGQQTDLGRWQDIGYCDDESLKCWVDTQDIKDVIHNKNISDEIILSGRTDLVESTNQKGSKDLENIFTKIDNYINLIKQTVEEEKELTKKKQIIEGFFGTLNTATEYQNINLQEMIVVLESVTSSTVAVSDKAQATYMKFRIFNVLGSGLVEIRDAMKEEKVTGSGVDSGVDGADSNEETKYSQNSIFIIKGSNSIIYYRFKESKWYSEKLSNEIRTDAIENLKWETEDNSLKGYNFDKGVIILEGVGKEEYMSLTVISNS